MPRKRRYLISAAVLVACIAATTAVIAMLPPRHGVMKANFDRIEEGMTMTEVEAILGKNGILLGHAIIDRDAIWREPDGSFAAFGFANDRVTQRLWVDSTETIPDKLRRWLGLAK